MSGIFKKVLISEKSFRDASVGKYTFLVDKKADKDEITKTCENLFNVTVLTVNTMNYSGKIKMTKRVQGKRVSFKKVILTLKAGDKIDLFETETSEKKQDTRDKKQTKKEAVKEEKKTKEDKDTTVTVKEKKK